jgi:hypothetical protein
MHEYRTNEFILKAVEKSSHKKGELMIFTRIVLKGNHHKGAIPVDVIHEYIFRYSKPWKDEEENEINSVTQVFQTPEERNIYCCRFFDSEMSLEEMNRKTNA